MWTTRILAAQDADALLILNDWQEFAELDLAKLHYTLALPDRDRRQEPLRSGEDDQSGFHLSKRGTAGLAQPMDPVSAFFLPRRRDGREGLERGISD